MEQKAAVSAGETGGAESSGSYTWKLAEQRIMETRMKQTERMEPEYGSERRQSWKVQGRGRRIRGWIHYDIINCCKASVYTGNPVLDIQQKPKGQSGETSGEENASFFSSGSEEKLRERVIFSKKHAMERGAERNDGAYPRTKPERLNEGKCGWQRKKA